jgi:hypothetical protein
MSKNVKLIVAVACLVLAAIILSWNFGLFSGEGGGGGGNTVIWFKCVNPDCNSTYSLKPEEFAKIQSESGMGPMMMMPGQQQAFKCQKCSQQSAYMAQKCEKCGEVFIMSMAPPAAGETPDYPDRCPKCSHSAIEEMSKEQK